ncbi:unnamed protein product [Mytilus coruscus]|uniref:Uncharacterized protein n=1 Tax=Mytilus coruscus TaxID=42192 RepID=A0A6J8CT96_MYTCO|nr:unnamed protein product [Mytilus coruscus]
MNTPTTCSQFYRNVQQFRKLRFSMFIKKYFTSIKTDCGPVICHSWVLRTTIRMKLAIATVAVLVCLCGMKGISATGYGNSGYGSSYGSSYGGVGHGNMGYGGNYGNWGGYGQSGYGSYGGYGKGGYSGYGHQSYSGYGKKGYSGYGKKGGFVDETITYMPYQVPVMGAGYGIGGGMGVGYGGLGGGSGLLGGGDSGLFGGSSEGLLLLLLIVPFLLSNLNNNNN